MIRNLILGTAISLFTFPGVILHELSHRFFCDITKTPVYEIKYFGISQSPLGYVAHKSTYGLLNNVLICLGPFIVNNLVAILLAMPYAIVLGIGAGSIYDNKDICSMLILFWLSFSCALHSFPSKVDITNLSEYVHTYCSSFTQLLYLPFRLIFFVQRILSIFLFDVFWALILIISQLYVWDYFFKIFPSLVSCRY